MRDAEDIPVEPDSVTAIDPLSIHTMNTKKKQFGDQADCRLIEGFEEKKRATGGGAYKFNPASTQTSPCEQRDVGQSEFGVTLSAVKLVDRFYPPALGNA